MTPRCDYCGKFIAYDDFYDKAERYLITPDTGFTSEEYGTHHKECQQKTQKAIKEKDWECNICGFRISFTEIQAARFNYTCSRCRRGNLGSNYWQVQENKEIIK